MLRPDLRILIAQKYTALPAEIPIAQFASTIWGCVFGGKCWRRCVLQQLLLRRPTPPPAPSKQDLKEAKSAYARGLKLQRDKHFRRSAAKNINSAVDLNPLNTRIFNEPARCSASNWCSITWRQAMPACATAIQIEALANFRNAADLDPQSYLRSAAAAKHNRPRG